MYENSVYFCSRKQRIILISINWLVIRLVIKEDPRICEDCKVHLVGKSPARENEKRVHVSEFFFFVVFLSTVNILTIQFLNSVRVNGLIMYKINVNNRCFHKVDFSF